MEIKKYPHRLKVTDENNNEISYSFDDDSRLELTKVLGCENENDAPQEVEKKFGKKIDKSQFEFWLHENEIRFQVFTWKIIEG